MKTDDFLRWLAEKNGYVHPVSLPGGRYACLNARTYNTQLIVGQIGNRIGYDDAW